MPCIIYLPTHLSHLAGDKCQFLVCKEIAIYSF
jgi:hypothetical protein